MFGDETIYGQAIVKKDSKNRIILPSFTHAEKNDSLLIVDSRTTFDIYKEEVYNKMLEDINLKIQCSNDSDKIKLKIEYLNICKTILRKVKCDSQNRIIVPNCFKDREEVLCIGAMDHVSILKIGGIK